MTHVFVPLSGSQGANGQYTRCAVGTGMLACPYPPDEHPAAPAPQPDEEPPTVLYAPLGYGTATAYVRKAAYDTLAADLAAVIDCLANALWQEYRTISGGEIACSRCGASWSSVVDMNTNPTPLLMNGHRHATWCPLSLSAAPGGQED